jgi:hypothetical protein
MHNLLDFRLGLITLRSVHVHFVTVEVGVVGCGDGEIQTEGGIGQDPHLVAHHGTSVEGWLTVEDHEVTVHDMTFDHHAVVELDFVSVLNVAQIELFAIIANDRFGTFSLFYDLFEIFEKI